MKLVRTSIGKVLLIAVVMALSAPAGAVSVSSGAQPHGPDLIASRYRSLANTGGSEIYLGIPDLGSAARRTEINILWQLGANAFTFTYDKPNNLLTTTVVNGNGTYSLTYPNVSAAIGGTCSVTTTQRCARPGDGACPLGESCNPAALDDLNLLQINIANRDSGTTVDLSSVQLDGNPLGTGTFSGGVGAPGNFLTWTATDYCFGAGFTLSGTLTLGGTFSGSQENNRVDFIAGIKDGGVCRAAAGACDIAESCTVLSPNCPADGFQSSGTCRASAGVCDVAESCNGSGPNCPADGFQNSGTCRASAGVCDVAESCNGSGPSCPADGFQSGGTCRASAGVCDVAESCNGSGPNCPANGFVANGTNCSDGSVCTGVDQCSSGVCVGASPLDCDDGSACTVDICDPIDGCESSGAGPAPGCRTAAKSLLVVSQATNDAKDKLIWRWIRGASTDLAEIAEPVSSADYSLCLYAGTAGTLIGSLEVGHGVNWTSLGAKGFKYKDRQGLQDGVQKALLRTSTVNKSRMSLKGKGNNLPDPTLPLSGPVVVQLVNNDTDICWESTFTSATKNTATRYKAKGP